MLISCKANTIVTIPTRSRESTSFTSGCSLRMMAMVSRSGGVVGSTRFSKVSTSGTFSTVVRGVRRVKEKGGAIGCELES